MNDSATTESAADYRVLARKYRPQSFDDLIGQEALVRTLKNALDQGRLAHAFVLTGVRGVGKTTTARIIAKGLNCIGVDGTGGPTVNPCGVCDNCRSITEDRHVDVMEMDAASHTGVDDIREIIDGVRYRPVSARYKVYIIDEVHMLSRNAFNALLKTLEEPPNHVKFVFATTEIRKVPITVLSRCQRFDLRRIGADDLIALFTSICGKEGVEAEPEALRLVARAADGSARDGLSLLDQAMALAAGPIAPTLVQEMLGLADRAEILDLFEDLMRGKLSEVLARVNAMHDLGVDPLVIAQDLLETTHLVTRFKVAPENAGQNVSEIERTKGGALAEALSTPHLGRAWQMFLKGITEIQQAPSPLAALEMMLIRLAHLSDMPSPADVIKTLRSGGTISGGSASPSATTGSSGAAATSALPSATPELVQETEAPNTGPTIPALDVEDAPPSDPIQEMTVGPPNPGSFVEIVALFESRREAVLHARLVGEVRPVRVEPGILEVAASPDVDSALVGALAKLLIEWTEQPWNVSIAEAVGEPTLVERKDAAEALVREEVSADPVVAAVLENFPGSAVEAVRPLIAQGIGEVEMHPEPIDDDDLYNDDDDDGGIMARVKDG
ncbi:DNA polymerase III subunit gamma/tau [Alphaproteobacteria bacterium]|nr:DNA polymerase III subunit gamma/tau [Alphaproteobacteria bacterium]